MHRLKASALHVMPISLVHRSTNAQPSSPKLSFCRRKAVLYTALTGSPYTSSLDSHCGNDCILGAPSRMSVSHVNVVLTSKYRITGNIPAVELLLEHGVDINAASSAGPPLMWALGKLSDHSIPSHYAGILSDIITSPLNSLHFPVKEGSAVSPHLWAAGTHCDYSIPPHCTPDLALH